MCGIIGIVGTKFVNQSLYDGLMVLQHRGQDAAGIMTCNKYKIFLRKSNGLVKDVFRTRHMKRLVGTMGIGHVRYPTAGCASSAEAQPFFVNSPYGIGLAHNGNLTNVKHLKKELFKTDLRHINTDSDSEVLLNILAHELQQHGKINLSTNNIFDAISNLHKRCEGGYAAVAIISNVGIIGIRDPHGIRPLIIGKRNNKNGTEYVIASESVVIDTLGFEIVGDVLPGEGVFISKSGQLHRKLCSPSAKLTPCLFEYVYLARPDSIIDGVHVHKSRLRMGDALGKKIKNTWKNHDIDVVIPIPDTSRTSALQLANYLGITYREGFIKNRYIGRTFIMPGQKLREKSVRQKLNPLPIEFKNKNVLLVDDSIVRGTTSAQIIEMARKAGAKKVYFASAAPAVKYPNVYGIDTPSVNELLAANRTDKEVAEFIGADKLIFQDLDDLKHTITVGNPSIEQFEASVFDGKYITGGIDDSYLHNLEKERSNAAKNKLLKVSNEDADSEIGVHNNA